MLKAYSDLLNCLNDNDPNYETGSAIIAIISPPLPFSYQVFVQSIPGRTNVGSGQLTSDANFGTVKALLESVKSNAELAFEVYTGRTVIPGSTQVDVGSRIITASYEVGGVAPVCRQ